jgi:hypothetical protein
LALCEALEFGAQPGGLIFVARLEPLDPLQTPPDAAAHRQPPTVAQSYGLGEHMSLSLSG